MSDQIDKELNEALTEAHAIEKQAIQLLEKAPKIAGDSDMGAIFRAHLLQTKEHARYVEERLEARGESPSKVKDVAMQASALGLGAMLQAASKSPIRLVTVAFAFENLEVATYRLVRELAERAGDTATMSVAERILEQEEAAAELVVGTLKRALEITLGEKPSSPVPSVTPIGKPSERGDDGTGTSLPGAQAARGRSPDEPVSQPPRVDSPTSADHSQNPEPGHPVGDTQPYGGDAPSPEQPEEIGAGPPRDS